MVNYRKWKGLGSSLLFLTIVATQFQNCAPAGPGITATGQDGGPSASLVDTIDDAVTSTGLAFNEKSIEIPVDVRLDILGILLTLVSRYKF